MATLTGLSSSPITSVRPTSARSIVPQDVIVEVTTNTQANIMFKRLQNMLRDFKKFDKILWSERLSAKSLNDLHKQFVKYEKSHRVDNRLYCGIAALIPLFFGTITGLATLSGDEDSTAVCGTLTGATGLGSAKFIYNKLSKSYANDLDHLHHIVNFALKQSYQQVKLNMNLENWYFLYHESIKKTSNEEHKSSILASAPGRNISDIEITTNRTISGDDTKRSNPSEKLQESERKESPKVANKTEDPDKNDDTKRSIPSKKPQESAKRENMGRKSTIDVQRRSSIISGSPSLSSTSGAAKKQPKRPETPGSLSLSSTSGAAAKKQPKRPVTPVSPNLSANAGPNKASENRNPAKRDSTVQ